MTLPPSSETARPAGARRVAVFGFDASESSQIRRIRGLIGAGFDVTGYTMRRDNMASDAPPEWRNIHLGTVENERIGRRLLVLARALLVIARNGGPLRRADVAPIGTGFVIGADTGGGETVRLGFAMLDQVRDDVLAEIAG